MKKKEKKMRALRYFLLSTSFFFTRGHAYLVHGLR